MLSPVQNGPRSVNSMMNGLVAAHRGCGLGRAAFLFPARCPFLAKAFQGCPLGVVLQEMHPEGTLRAPVRVVSQNDCAFSFCSREQKKTSHDAGTKSLSVSCSNCPFRNRGGVGEVPRQRPGCSLRARQHAGRVDSPLNLCQVKVLKEEVNEKRFCLILRRQPCLPLPKWWES